MISYTDHLTPPRVRSQLAEELGADPCPPLRELHQRILTADPTLMAPAIAVTGPGSARLVVPAQRPADIATFTGAHDCLAHAHHALNQPDQARTHWQQALAIYTQLGTPEAADIRTHLATH